MPLDMLLVNAFLSLTPRQSEEDKQRIIDALENDETDIYIPGMRSRKVKLSIDYAVFMFCYPWEVDSSYAAHYTRQPLPQNYNQSSTEYGNYSFKLANQYDIDVMVGYWNGRDYSRDPKNIFHNFRNSISKYTEPLPKIAYSMGFYDPAETFVKDHIKLLWDEEFNLPRYCRLYDRANRWRFPVIFWGVDEVGPGDVFTQPSETHIREMGRLLRELKKRSTSDGAQAYVIWHSQILNRYFNTTAHHDLFKAEVIDQIDALYQHEIAIPKPVPPITWRQIDTSRWDEFPHVTMDPAGNLEETRAAQKRIQQHGFKASDGFLLPVIPGCMPQFSRERYSYLEHARDLDKLVDVSRVNCTDISQLSQTLQSVGDLAETNRLIQDELSWTVRRIVALTSWNEWREGTAWEPGAADNNDPNIFGLTNTNTDERFLTQAKKAFAPRKIKYTIGTKKRPEPGPLSV